MIFDTRIAKESYKHHNYYRTRSFTVKGGECADLVLTTSRSLNSCASFDIIRIPVGHKGPLPKHGVQFFENKTTPLCLGLGNTHAQIKVPGTYYLIARKDSDNIVLDDEENPTFVEVFIS